MDSRRDRREDTDTAAAADDRGLPTGVVTFMLTDVEGSTRLWEGAPDDAARLIARHYQLLDAAVALHGGVRPVEQGEGDSVVAVFIHASDAVAAALDVQRAFVDEPWPAGQPVRIRVAVHTGEVALRDAGNYFGPTVIRCARLRAIGHGGQVLLSDTARDLVVDRLPGNSQLRDLGAHRLKDLGRTERVWQLVHPDLPADFAPLTSLEMFPTNVPFRLTSFVGRDDEVAMLADALAAERLVTLIGAGGCGKTRLALHAVAQRIGQHTGGVWLVELGAVTRSDEIAYAVARVFGLRKEHGRALVDTLVEQLHDSDALVLLDNCEHLLDGAATLVDTLLRAIPGLHVLATSREPLGVEGEVSVRVGSLAAADAVELFVDRSRHVRPGFVPVDDELGVIVDIVERLEGMPLAIELAAARIRMMAPASILSGLDDRFRLLGGAARTPLVARQHTLEASVAWSYELLDEDERSVARRLSVLHGFTLDTAEKIGAGGAIGRYQVLDLLTRLVDKSLVDVMHLHGEKRFRMLETIREYLHRQLVASGELVDVRRRHLDAYVDLAEGLAPRLAFGDGPVHLARLEVEHANLDAALEWAASSGQRDALLRLAVALTLLWELRGHFAYGAGWFARGFDDHAVIPSPINARALWGAAHIALYGNDWDLALRRSAEALAMAEAVGDEWTTARALNTVGVLQATSEPAAARASLARSIELAERTGDLWAVADGWKMISVTKVIEHDDAGAVGPLDELRRVAERLDSKFFLGWYHAEVGYFAHDRGEFDDARIALNASVRCCELVGDPSTGGFAQTWLAVLEADTGDITGGIRRLDQVLAHASATGSDLAAPEALYARGRLALGQGDPGTALALTTEFIETSRNAGLPTWVAQALVVAAHAHRLHGNLSSATRAIDEATSLAAPFHSTFLECLIDHERANILRAGDQPNAAEDLLLTVLTRQIDAALRPGAIQTLETLASCALVAESPAEATRCYAASHALRELIGYIPTPVEQATIDTGRAACRASLGDATFESNHDTASTASLGEIAEWLSRARGRRHRPSSGWASLTPTELRVSTLVAEGLTNPQIAQRMFIAKGTAKIHVSHIFNKLGLTTRAQLATEVTSRLTSQPKS